VPEAGGSAAALVAALRNDSRLGPQIVGALYAPGEAAAFAEPAAVLPEALRRALTEVGASPLWSHQARSLDALGRGEHLLLATPTASGKSLVFQLPVLGAALERRPERALFLFPLKALGQDQRAKLARLGAAAGLGSEELSVAIYDGDTPPAERARLRRRPPRVLISNPDMLHLGLLPFWPQWAPFFRELRWIVLDEVHVYRGLFGGHMHHVLRRLLRLCRSLGADPLLVAASATVGEAGSFASTLAGELFTAVERSGAPRPGRHLLLVQPSASPYTTSLQLLVGLLERGERVIVFTKARRVTELLHAALVRQHPELAARVANYRAGFLAEERREIEARLFSGELQGVIATSALELGIDIGGLDACVLVGYPGSVLGLRQRSGRAGRGGRESLTALVALPDALDQYLLEHPGPLLHGVCERPVLDPANPEVARRHLVCAAAELPLRPAEEGGYLAPHTEVVRELLAGQQLREVDGTGELVAAAKRPHRGVDLRGTGEGFRIVDLESGRPIGSIDGVRVFHECHPGAVYLHAGRQWQVEELRIGEREVAARRVEVDHFTSALSEKTTAVLELFAERGSGGLRAALARLRITERVVGYERKRLFSQQVLEQRPLDLPAVEFEAHGLFWLASPELEVLLREAGRHLGGSLHAAEHAAIGLLPLLVLCDRGDLGGISTPFHPQLGSAAVFVYEGRPGGLGLVRQGFAALPELLGRVAERLATCSCDEGCPACIQSPKCGNGNRPLDKEGARLALAWWLDPSAPTPVLQLRDESAPAERTAACAPPADDPPREAEEPAAAPAAPRPRAGEVRRTVLFDVETKRSAAEVGGWGNAHRMGVAVAVACHLEENRFETFREEEVAGLVAALRGADLVVGFNIRRFDYRVLSGYTGEDHARTLPTLDLLDDVHAALGFRLGLDHLARETLGAEKSADGLQSLEWVREGRLDLVEAYCRHDVEILRDLYLFGRREGYLRYRDRAGRLLRLPVSW
jgi:DEAD/DEAH box helicase domain-containing protein